MKLMLRPEWRPRPFSTFLGFLDIKTGVVITLMFALFNKVAGVYGLIAVLTGAGGSAAQLSMYIYSTMALVVLGWGLKIVKEEDARKTLYLAHMFFADHVFSTAWTVFFAVQWWIYTLHDGRRVPTSSAQLGIIKNYLGKTQDITDSERAELATSLWNREKNFALLVIILGWLSKIYLALVIYSYAIHLRKGSYRNLPYTRPNMSPMFSDIPLVEDEEDQDVEDFYRVPIRTPKTGSFPLANGNASKRNNSRSRPVSRSSSGRSISQSDTLFDSNESNSGSRYGVQEGSLANESENASLVGGRT